MSCPILGICQGAKHKTLFLGFLARPAAQNVPMGCVEMTMAMERTSRGEFTVFLGAASGAGKTRVMLQSALARHHEGVDVVIGALQAESSFQAESSWVSGLPELARLSPNGDPRLLPQELNVDEVLSRRPQLVVIDRLAHTNPDGAPRLKRYQDIEAILVSGIDVYTTLNIYEIESYHDIVVKVTGVTAIDTVPDKYLEHVQHIQLVDTPPDDLVRGFEARRVNSPGDAELGKFYRRGNLIALRELALRYTALHVDRQLEEYMHSNEIMGPWPVSEKVMVCVSASPFSEQLIRFTRQMASNLKVDWLAVYIETPRRLPRSPQERDILERNLRLAEELGAETLSITGKEVGDELVRLARERNVKEIVIGKPRHSRLWEWLHGSVLDQVIRNSIGISVHVIPGMSDSEQGKSAVSAYPRETIQGPSYVIVTLFIGILTFLLHPFQSSFNLVNIALLYLLPVLVSAVRWGLLPAFYAALVGLVTFDWFFVPPFYSFAVSDLRYLISFTVFLTVAVLTASLASRLRQQLHSAKQREAVTSALYTVSRQITAIGDLETMLQTLVQQISQTIGTEVGMFLPDEAGELQWATHSSQASGWGTNSSERTIAQWVHRNGEMAGRGTKTLRESPDLYIPLRTEEHTYGVLAVNLKGQEALDTERLKMIEALARLAAVAIVRMKLSEEAKLAHVMAESERLQTAILDSLSHELRTPLAAIIGSVTGLLESGDVFSNEDRNELLVTIREGAMRMNRLVTNLLGMVRLESGMLQLHKKMCDLEDIIGVSIRQVRESLQRRKVKVMFEQHLPRIPVDDVLMEQVMVNLLSNAVKYSPDASEIEISVQLLQHQVAMSVSDQGIGIPQQEAERIFDKFHRSPRTLHIPGTGLGLAICKGIVEAHGGRITATVNRANGTTFTIYLPVSDKKNTSGQDFNQPKVGVEYV